MTTDTPTQAITAHSSEDYERLAAQIADLPFASSFVYEAGHALRTAAAQARTLEQLTDAIVDAGCAVIQTGVDVMVQNSKAELQARELAELREKVAIWERQAFESTAQEILKQRIETTERELAEAQADIFRRDQIIEAAERTLSRVREAAEKMPEKIVIEACRIYDELQDIRSEPADYPAMYNTLKSFLLELLKEPGE